MTNLGEIKVAFSYKGNERQKTFITVKNSGGDVLIETSVKRSIHDTHDKILARFFAFKKAMNQLMLRNIITREQRKTAWQKYKASVRIPGKINLESKVSKSIFKPVNVN